MHIEQTSRFAKAVKKLHPNQKADLNDAIHALIAPPPVTVTFQAINHCY
jgi:hypothetical protein